MWPAPKPSEFWTDARVDQLRTLIGQGHSAGQAARAIGCSRSAAVGKASRVGIALAPPHRKNTYSINIPRPVKARPAKLDLRVDRSVPMPRPAKPTIISLDQPSATEKPWLQRVGRQCHWPTKNHGADMWMCCAATEEGAVYCAAHQHVGTVTTKKLKAPQTDRNVVAKVRGDEDPQPIDLEQAATPMLERIVCEMADAQGQWEKANSRIGGEQPWTQPHLELLARAALLALAEPTEEMLDAAWQCTRDAGSEQRMFALLGDAETVQRHKAATRFTAMIKAANPSDKVQGAQR